MLLQPTNQIYPLQFYINRHQFDTSSESSRKRLKKTVPEQLHDKTPTPALLYTLVYFPRVVLLCNKDARITSTYVCGRSLRQTL